MTPAKYLRVVQAADFIGCSASTLAKKRVSGTGPSYYKLGRIVVYAMDDLNDWIQKQRRSSTSQDV